MKTRNEWIIPDVVLVGYGRSQAIQIQCLSCKLRYFPDDVYSPVCEDCIKTDWKNELEDWRILGKPFTLNVVGWEQRVPTIGNRGRSRHNYNKIYKRDLYTCQYCGYQVVVGELIPLHIDHVIPFSYGGNYKMNNLVVACQHCNSFAADKLFDNFIYKKLFIQDVRKSRGMSIYNYDLCPFEDILKDYESGRI